MNPPQATSKRRLWIAGMSALFAAACLWRVFHFPYRRDALLLAVPPGAVWAAEQPNLSAAWRGMLENPIVRGSLAAAGVKEESVESLLNGRRIEPILDPLASRNTVAAYIPASARDGPAGPAWIAASWVGFRAPMLRWRWMGKAMGRSAIKRRLKPGVNIWTRIVARDEAPWFLSACVVRGAVYACLSRDPFGVQYVVFRVNRGSGVVPFMAGIAASAPPAGSAEHLGWFLAPWKTDEAGGEMPVHYSLSGLDAKSARGTIRMSPRSLGIEPAPMPSGWEGAVELLGDRPCAFAALEKEQLRPILNALVKKGSRAFDPLLSSSPAGAPAFVCMISGVESNRVRGLKFPGFLVGCRTDMAPDGLHARIMGTLDLLNRDGQFRLIPRRMRDGGHSWVRIESSDSGILANLRECETPAIAVEKGWLIAAGSEALLRFVLEDQAPGGEPRWKPLLAQGSFAPAVWFDAGPACRSLRDGVAVMTLAAIAGGDTEAGRVRRARLDRAKAWLQHVQQAGVCAVTVEPGAAWTTVRFEMKAASR